MAYKGFDLTGKVSLVTGGNGGIGFGMADALAEAGADVCIWGTNPKKNAAAVEKLKRHGRKVHAQIVDVGDESQVQAAFAETLKVMGHVDNCVANAGVSGRGKGSILEMDYEEWRRVTRVNLDGVFFTFRAAARHMIDNGQGGSLAVTASTAAADLVLARDGKAFGPIVIDPAATVPEKRAAQELARSFGLPLETARRVVLAWIYPQPGQ